jgi:hypothetical protein
MGTKRTTTEGAASAAKAAPKRKIGVRPGIARARKAATVKTVRPSAARETESTALASIPTEVVALRAYFISEARQATGQPGDSLADWLEAERQVRAEIKA